MKSKPVHVRHLRNKHEGEEITIVASGVSLIDFPWSILEGMTTIAVNYSIFAPAQFSYWFMTDYSDEVKKVLHLHHGKAPLVAMHKTADPDYLISKTRDAARASIRKAVFLCCSRTLLLAMQFAILLGAAQIQLLGCDCYRLKDQKYFTNIPMELIPLRGEEIEMREDDLYTSLSLRKTAAKLSQMKNLGVFDGPKIVNYSEHSLIS